MFVLDKEKKNVKSYKLSRWLLIFLALASIPLDLQKMYEDIEKSKVYLNKSMLDTINFYSSTLTIHFVGLSSAWEHEIWLTVSCRLLSAIIYQYELNSRKNETLPNDPDEMQKMIHEKYPQYLRNPAIIGDKKYKKVKKSTNKKSQQNKKKKPIKNLN